MGEGGPEVGSQRFGRLFLADRHLLRLQLPAATAAHDPKLALITSNKPGLAVPWASMELSPAVMLPLEMCSA